MGDGPPQVWQRLVADDNPEVFREVPCALDRVSINGLQSSRKRRSSSSGGSSVILRDLLICGSSVLGFFLVY